jgi:hypothetical protein
MIPGKSLIQSSYLFDGNESLPHLHTVCDGIVTLPQIVTPITIPNIYLPVFTIYNGIINFVLQ